MGKILIVCITLLTVVNVNAQKINQKESKVEFEIGNLGLSSVDGTIEEMKGIVKFDANNLSSSKFDVTVSPSTIDTENEERDEHLKNEDFFDIEKYKTVRFVSSSIYKKGNQYIAKGKLTLLNTTKEIEIPFSVKESNGKTIFEGEIEINRFHYGLAAESYKSTFSVGKTAEVKIICVVE